MRSRMASQRRDLVRPLGHNRNVCDLRRPCGQHGTVGGIENGIHWNLTAVPKMEANLVTYRFPRKEKAQESPVISDCSFSAAAVLREFRFVAFEKAKERTAGG